MSTLDTHDSGPTEAIDIQIPSPRRIGRRNRAIIQVSLSPEPEPEASRPAYPAASVVERMRPTRIQDSADSESEDEEALFVSAIQRGNNAIARRGRHGPTILPGNLATSANAVHPNHSRSWAANRLHAGLADSQRDWEGEEEDDLPWRPRLWPKDDHDVWELRCNSCNCLVCSRAQKEVFFASRSFERNSTGKRFASDAPPPETVSALPDEEMEERKGCSCTRIAFGCRTCGQVLGYHITELCSSCTRYSRRSPPMPFFFLESAVVPSIRQDSTEKYGWEDLPPLKEDYADGLIGDPCDWLFPAASGSSRALPWWLPYRKPAHFAWSCPNEAREAVPYDPVAMRESIQPRRDTREAVRAAEARLNGVSDHDADNFAATADESHAAAQRIRDRRENLRRRLADVISDRQETRTDATQQASNRTRPTANGSSFTRQQEIVHNADGLRARSAAREELASAAQRIRERRERMARAVNARPPTQEERAAAANQRDATESTSRSAQALLADALDRRYTFTRAREEDTNEEISMEEFLADRRSRSESWGSRRDRLKHDRNEDEEEQAANWDDKDGREIHYWLQDRVQYGMLASDASARPRKRRALADFENR